MKHLLSVLAVSMVLGCQPAKAPSEYARDACKIAMAADPFVQSLVPAWGSTVDAVVTAVCALPDIIKNFETLPAETAKTESLKSLKRMTSVQPK